MSKRFLTIEVHKFGKHKYKIQESCANRGFLTYRVHHQYLGRIAVNQFVGANYETEGGCRLVILRHLAAWPSEYSKLRAKSFRFRDKKEK